MKVMFVNGSSHLHGTTMAAIEEMEKVFRAEGIETEVIQVGGKPIADCLQCNVCGKTGKCVFTDDEMCIRDRYCRNSKGKQFKILRVL